MITMDEVKAKARFIRGSHHKLRRYVNAIRGKDALEAVDMLEMMHGANCRRVLKVVPSGLRVRVLRPDRITPLPEGR